MNNILKARYKVLYDSKSLDSLRWISPDISVIKFTGTPENIKQIKCFLPEGSFVKKEESGIFYLNTIKELFFNDSKKTNEGVLIKEPIHINDWLSVDSCNEAECIKEKDFHKTVTLED
jgi:hypothetical protein